jgi:hypothetical protein
VWVLTFAAAAKRADASAEPPKHRSKPMTSEAEPSARQLKFDEQRLAALLPASLGDWALKRMWKPLPVGPFQLVPLMQAEYAHGRQMVEVTFTGLVSVTKSDVDRGIVHKRDEASGENIAMVGLVNGITVLASSRQADADALTRLLDAINLSYLGRLENTNK